MTPVRRMLAVIGARSHPFAVLATFGLLALSGCAAGSAQPPPSNASAGVLTGSERTTVLTVGAASSFTNVLPTIGHGFEQSHPSVSIRYSFAASSAVAEQVRQGAPIDVFASAGSAAMEPVAREGLVTHVTPFATNAMTIATPAGNPGKVTTIADLPRVSLAICQPQVPCGRAADDLLQKNRLTVTPVSLEADARAVLAKVEADEVDAGLVYFTDVRAAGNRVTGVPIPEEANVTTSCEAGIVQASGQAQLATEFVRYLQSPESQKVLLAAGFGAAHSRSPQP